LGRKAGKKEREGETGKIFAREVGGVEETRKLSNMVSENFPKRCRGKLGSRSGLEKRRKDYVL